jgi:hypothetical protein
MVVPAVADEESTEMKVGVDILDRTYVHCLLRDLCLPLKQVLPSNATNLTSTVATKPYICDSTHASFSFTLLLSPQLPIASPHTRYEPVESMFSLEHPLKELIDNSITAHLDEHHANKERKVRAPILSNVLTPHCISLLSSVVRHGLNLQCGTTTL